MIVLILSIVSLSINSIDSVIVRDHNYFVDGIHGFIGGTVGFVSAAYITFFSLSTINHYSENFTQELGYLFGYTIGMPICASSFIHFSPYNKNHSRKSFVKAIKNSLIGVQLGLCTILISSHISKDAKYWAGLFVLPFPIIGAVSGHNSVPLEIKDNNKDTLMESDSPKLCFRILYLDLR
ncbi:MAG: hypothetical protein ABIL46_00440 [candidate division WOR-3 bacterium]